MSKTDEMQHIAQIQEKNEQKISNCKSLGNSIMDKLNKQKGNAETIRTLLGITQNLAQHMNPSDLEALNQIRKNNEMSSLVFSSPKSKKTPQQWGGIDLMSSPALENEKKEMLKAACAQLEKEKEGAEAQTNTVAMQPKKLFEDTESESESESEFSAPVDATPAVTTHTEVAPVVAAPVVAPVVAPVGAPVAAPVGAAPPAAAAPSPPAALRAPCAPTNTTVEEAWAPKKLTWNGRVRS